MKNRYKFGAGAYAIFALFLAVVILVNVFTSLIVKKFDIKLDMTTQKMYEITDTTKEFLKDYDIPTTIYITASDLEQSSYEYFVPVREILDKYAKLNSNIHIKSVDLSDDPSFGSKYVQPGQTITRYSVIVDAGERFKVLTLDDLYDVNYQQSQITGFKAEKKLTSTLKYILNDSNFKVYFITGHGETAADGAKQYLNDANFETEDLDITLNDIPEDASIISIINPIRDFSVGDITKLDAFFAKGGNGQIHLNSLQQNLPNLTAFIREWGIEVNNDVVFENPEKSNRIITALNNLNRAVIEDTSITEDINAANGSVVYYYSKSLNVIADQLSACEVTPLLSSSDNSYSKPFLGSDTESEPASDDRQGPFVLSAVSTKESNVPGTSSSLIVTGDMMFITANPDEIELAYGFDNFKIYLNGMLEMTGQQDETAISSKKLSSNMLVEVTPSHQKYILYSFLLIPVIILIIGIVVWLKRRNA